MLTTKKILSFFEEQRNSSRISETKHGQGQKQWNSQAQHVAKFRHHCELRTKRPSDFWGRRQHSQEKKQMQKFEIH